jgi:hypothetical protein
MDQQRIEQRAVGTAEPRPWVPPSFEVISLDCEITSYAPDGDQPLF